MQKYKQALAFGKTNKSAKIPYTLIAHLRVLAKCGSRFVSCTMVCEDSGTFLI